MQRSITIELPDVQHDWLDAVARDTGLSRSELVRRALTRIMSARPETNSAELNNRVAKWLETTQL